MFQTMLKSFRAAFVTSALTAFSVTFLTSLAANDDARQKQTDAARPKPVAVGAPAVAPVWPQTGAVRVIDTRRMPSETAVQPSRATRRDRGAA